MMKAVCPNCKNDIEPGGEICRHCGMVILQDTPILNSGVLLQQRYEIVRLLHVGGMGYVYLATDRKVYNRLCVIKQVKAPVRIEADRAKLQQEAVRMAGLYHPNVASIYEDFEERGYYFLVVQYIEGKNLNEAFEERGGKISEAEVVNWAVSMCDVISYIHREGVIHRDISPDNIMLTPDNTIMFIDFGTMREIQQISFRGTAGAGKFGFTPLEQWLGKPVPQSDIFAIGATIYYLLTGYLPVTAEYKKTSQPEVADYRPEFPLVRTKRPDISRELEAILQKALSIEVNARYQSSQAFKDDLSGLMSRARARRPKVLLKPKKATYKLRFNWSLTQRIMAGTVATVQAFKDDLSGLMNRAGARRSNVLLKPQKATYKLRFNWSLTQRIMAGAVATVLLCTIILAAIFIYPGMRHSDTETSLTNQAQVPNSQLNKSMNQSLDNQSEKTNTQTEKEQNLSKSNAPATAAKPTSFESALYMNPDYGFSVSYPKSWLVETYRMPTLVLVAGVGGVVNSNNREFIAIDIRPATELDETTVVKDLTSRSGVIISPNIESVRTIALADGKTVGKEILVSASVLTGKMYVYCLSVVRDGKAITVVSGIQQKNLDLYKEIVETLTFKQ